LALVMLIRPLIVRVRDAQIDTRASSGRWPLLGQIAIAAATAFLALWAAYLFDVGRLADQSLMQSQRTWTKLPARLKDAPTPMPSFTLGVLWQLSHNRSGHPAYLNG